MDSVTPPNAFCTLSAYNTIYRSKAEMRSSRKNQGSAESKLKMAKALADMELTDQTINLLGDEGAIPPLAKMISG